MTTKEQYEATAASADEYIVTNDARVLVSSFNDEQRKTHTERYTVFCKDPDDCGEEIDLDVVKGTPRKVIIAAAKFVIARDYDPSLSYGSIEQRFGMYF